VKSAPPAKSRSKPSANKPNKPAANRPAARKSAANKPAAKRPAANKPAAKKTAANKPAATKAATNKPRKPAKQPKAVRASTPSNLSRTGRAVDRIPETIEPGAGALALTSELSGVVAVEVAAEAALEAGEARRAVVLYTQLIETSGTPHASHLVARGRAHYGLGNYEQAIGDYESGLAIEPRFPDLYFDKGKAELQAGRVGDADASFTRDLELGPSPISFYNRHLARKALGDRDGALADLDRAIEGLPDEVALRVARSTLRASAGDGEGALADAEAAVELDPTDVTLHERCGRLALAIGQHQRAADAYGVARRIAIEAGELPDVEHLAGEALALGQLGRHAEALASLDHALAIAPDDPTLHCNRGWLLHVAGRDVEALADLDRAIALDPGYAKALQNRATIHTARGDRNRALADYRRLDELGHDVREAIARLVSP